MTVWVVVLAAVVLLAPWGPEPRRLVTPPADRPLAAAAVVAGRWPRRLLGRPPDPVADRSWAVLAAAGVAALAVSPVLALALPSVAVVWHLARRRLARRRQEAARAAALPEVLELVAVAIRAGGTVRTALVLAAERGPAVVAPAFGEVLAASSAGLSLLDALDDLPAAVGEGYRPLTAALVSAERDGAPLVGVVAQLARDAHDARRRAAEVTARQVPVRLLLPLVCCTLPAVLIVTIVPLVAVGGGLAD